jgi:hypothetical protein
VCSICHDLRTMPSLSYWCRQTASHLFRARVRDTPTVPRTQSISAQVNECGVFAGSHSSCHDQCEKRLVGLLCTESQAIPIASTTGESPRLGSFARLASAKIGYPALARKIRTQRNSSPRSQSSPKIYGFVDIQDSMSALIAAVRLSMSDCLGGQGLIQSSVERSHQGKSGAPE